MLGIEQFLVALMEHDDIESYLVTFERIMTVHKGRRPYYVIPQLMGKAQLAFAVLPVSDSADYDVIKMAIPVRYNINEDMYKNRFQSSKQKEGETNRVCCNDDGLVNQVVHGAQDSRSGPPILEPAVKLLNIKKACYMK